MTKAELIAAIAADTNMTKKDTDAFLQSAIKTLTAALAAGEKVALPGFGTFEVKDRAAREGRNPRTGEVVAIPASKAPAFKPGKDLKDAVNK